MVKRILILLMIALLMFSLLAGCNKDKQGEGSIGDVAGADNNDKEQQKESDTSENQDIQYIDYVLYLKHDKLPYIFGERFEIASNDSMLKDKSIEEIALERLISYQQVESFITPIPKDTKLLGVEKKDNKVYVDLSKEFADNMKKNEAETKIAIASIVNTLTFFPENEEVIITINGETMKKLNGVEMDKGFKFSSEFIPDK